MWVAYFVDNTRNKKPAFEVNAKVLIAVSARRSGGRQLSSGGTAMRTFALKTDRCRELLRQAGHRSDTLEAFCAKEASFAPDRFDLINRITAQSKTRLQYIWRTAQPTEFAGFCEVTVTRAGTEWVVTDYQRAY